MRISWLTSVSGCQALKVFDVLRRKVATLVEYRNAGSYKVEFNVGQDSSPAIASEIYFYRL